MKIGIADTNFAWVDMASIAIGIIKENSKHDIERYTVPGFKDLSVACKRLFKEHNCDIVIAMGMAGGASIDLQCAHEAAMGIQMVQVEESKHIIEVFVFQNESDDDKELFDIAKNRTEKHTLNALALLKGKEELTKFAGQGLRQGKEDRGPINLE